MTWNRKRANNNNNNNNQTTARVFVVYREHIEKKLLLNDIQGIVLSWPKNRFENCKGVAKNHRVIHCRVAKYVRRRRHQKRTKGEGYSGFYSEKGKERSSHGVLYRLSYCMLGVFVLECISFMYCSVVCLFVEIEL